MINLIDKANTNCLSLLSSAESSISRFDAEMILSSILGVNRSGLYIYDKEVSAEECRLFHNFVDKRSQGMPLQYILGKTEFMGLEFEVNPDVLIPRPETELLVQEAVRIIRDKQLTNGVGAHLCVRPASNRADTQVRPYILDLGTGSGNIAIALTKLITDCTIISSDVSEKALFVARRNAELNLVSGKIKFVLSDIFDSFSSEKFDIIASNPPYIASSELGALQKELKFEPRGALDGGADGLDYYRKITRLARGFLKKNGILILEAGFGQAEYIEKLLEDSGYFAISTILDYNNIKRVVVAEWKN